MFTRNVLMLGIAALVGLGACNGGKNGDQPGGSGDASGPITIGHYASMTGKEATFGTQVDAGIRLAVEEINASGGVLGRTIEVKTEDTQSQTQAAANAVEKLIGRDEVVALLGEVASGRTMAAAPIAEREKVPMLSPASTNEKVTLAKDGNALKYVFRICFIDPFQGEVMAKFASQNLGKRRIALLVDKANAYSVGLAKNFSEKLAQLGGQIVIEQAYEGGQADFKAQLTAIKASNPEAIFVPGYYTEVSLIATQARELGITIPLLGGDGWDSPTLTQGAAGKALEGCFFSNHFSEQDTSAIVQNFVKTFRAKFNEEAGAMAALGYDAMKILAKVIADAGKADRESIATGLAKLTN
ncbi:MAG TPA: ABC transporter substrate-binding protein, partial [Candidatus Kapabacteria bacterium]|nr:ABC transporter substrate-binding protein [Candidatus Kapabacteria bacterium]